MQLTKINLPATAYDSEQALKKITKHVTAFQIMPKNPDNISSFSAAIKEAEAFVKNIREYRKRLTQPFTDIINEAKAEEAKLCDSIENACKTAREAVKRAMSEQAAAARKKQEEADKQREDILKNKTLSPGEKLSQMSKVNDADITPIKGVSKVSKKSAVVTDAALIPREFLIPDFKKIDEAIAQGIDIPGITVVIDQNVRLL